MIHVKKADPRDIGLLAGQQVSTQEFPLTTDQINRYIGEPSKEVYMARVASRYIGHIAALFALDESTCWIHSIGVDQRFRRVGVGRKLVDFVTTSAYASNLSKVKIAVPSYVIEDHNDPWNIEGWLWKVGFKANGVIPDCIRYGKNYDWYAFERMVPGGKQDSRGGTTKVG